MTEALELLQKNKDQEAAEILETIPMESTEFIDALTELEKIYYRRENWQRFFSYATFYRKHFLSDENRTRTFFNSNLLALEVLALSRHCLWDAAQKIALSSLNSAKKLDIPSTESLKKAIDFLGLQHTFPEAHPGKEDRHRPKAIFSKELIWELQPGQILQVAHPKFLRIRVESRCES